MTRSLTRAALVAVLLAVLSGCVTPPKSCEPVPDLPETQTRKALMQYIETIVVLYGDCASR